MPARIHAAPAIIAILLLQAGCAVFGDDGPKDHTVIDYETVDPSRSGDLLGDYRYGHTGTTHQGTGVDKDAD